jgi:hypothetical protein
MLFPLTRTFRVLAQSLGTPKRAAIKRGGRKGDHRSAIFEPLEDRTLMSTYYVSASAMTATVAPAPALPGTRSARSTRLVLKAGDQVLFQGGQTFSGGLRPKNGGLPASPITFSSYGGRATIKSGGSEGLYTLSMSGFNIDNLTFIGSPSGKSQYGLRFETNNGNQSNIRVNNCDISGYGSAAILVMGDRNGIGFSNVQITSQQAAR